MGKHLQNHLAFVILQIYNILQESRVYGKYALLEKIKEVLPLKKLISVFLVVILIATILPGCGIFDSDSDSGNHSHSAQKCTLCNGAGKTKCSWCQGKGYMKVSDIQYPCNSCAGSGKANCLGCSGTGYKGGSGSSNSGNVIVPNIGIGSGSSASTCYTCKGAGKVTCSSCHGTGYLENTQYAPDFGYGGGSYQTSQRCYACSGSGLVMCTSCMGDGFN